MGLEEEIATALAALYKRARTYGVDRQALAREEGLYETVTRVERVLPLPPYPRMTASGWWIMRVIAVQNHRDGEQSYVLVPESRTWLPSKLPGRKQLVVVLAHTDVWVFSREVLKANGFHPVS